MDSAEPDIPTFSLPEWGSQGAPILTGDYLLREQDSLGMDDDLTDCLLSDREQFVVVTTERVPGASETRALGAVSGEWVEGFEEEKREALVIARAKAQELLATRAQQMGANGVVGLRFDLAIRKNTLVVVASGTAVLYSRFRSHPVLF